MSNKTLDDWKESFLIEVQSLDLNQQVSHDILCHFNQFLNSINLHDLSVNHGYIVAILRTLLNVDIVDYASVSSILFILEELYFLVVKSLDIKSI